MKIGILNVTGYAGAELARILHRHPEVEIVEVTGRSSAGQGLGEIFPHLASLDLIITDELAASVDVVFSALPHRVSAAALTPILDQGIRTIDISADFRLHDIGEYERWYETSHPCEQHLEKAVYGLTELNRHEIAQTKLVANPGCYPTATILALAPAIAAGIIDLDIVVDAKSGVSGAGRKSEIKNLFSEVNENTFGYSVDGHRHLPEITQELGSIAGSKSPKVVFVAHLIPITRGILASCYAPLGDRLALNRDVKKAEVKEIYDDFYRGEPFVKVVASPPMTKQTLGSNACLVYPTVDVRTNRLIVISCIDNLVKGAAGQAVQNMNSMLGMAETMGLEQLALYP